MALTASCPTCHAPLQLTNHDTFDSWVCPAGHGLAATLSELYERAQEDEIHRLWHLAREAARSGASPSLRACPMCERPMVSVTAPTDADEAEEGAEGDGPDTGEVAVDVCVADEVVWFDVGELEAFPADLPDPQLTAEQEAALTDIVHQFGESFEEGEASRAGFTDRLANRLRRSPKTVGMIQG